MAAMTPSVFSVRVLFDSTPLPADGMDAGDAQVQHVDKLLVEVECAPSVQDVHLAAQQQAQAFHLARNDVHVLKVEQRARSGNAGAVFRDAQHLEAPLAGGRHHLVQCVVCVARGYRVSVYVEQRSKGSLVTVHSSLTIVHQNVVQRYNIFLALLPCRFAFITYLCPRKRK